MKSNNGARPEWKSKPVKVWSYTRDVDLFAGEYIAYAGFSSDVIVAHGKDALRVLAEAKKYVERPVLTLIPVGGVGSFVGGVSR